MSATSTSVTERSSIEPERTCCQDPQFSGCVLPRRFSGPGGAAGKVTVGYTRSWIPAARQSVPASGDATQAPVIVAGAPVEAAAAGAATAMAMAGTAHAPAARTVRRGNSTVTGGTNLIGSQVTTIAGPRTALSPVWGTQTRGTSSRPPLTIGILDNNLRYMRTEAPLLAPIFRSEGQARLLSALLLGDDELSITDLASRAGLAYPTTHREVERLLEAGILSERSVGRTRLIRGNVASPLVAPLREILRVATGPVVLLTEELEAIEGVEVALLYGSYAARALGHPGPSPSDIDLMVIGSPDAGAIYDAAERVGMLVGRAVNPTILSSTEAAEERESGFLRQVASQPIVELIGSAPWT